MGGITIQSLSVRYGGRLALADVTVAIGERRITALIGPSGCGKSTFLRCLNRMNDTVAGARVEGRVLIDDRDIYAPDTDLSELRRRVGMVFQRPNPFPQSVFDNVAFGPRVLATHRGGRLAELVEASLRAADLWEEVKDDLQQDALALALGQQQRLCIARALAVAPQVILMDEPCSALDVEGTGAIEELMFALRGRYTIVIVTHNMAQARRTSDECLFMLLGEVVEHGRTEDLFLAPKNPRTAEYVEGRYA
jgi:phosphate transport system ATP-binding protein